MKLTYLLELQSDAKPGRYASPVVLALAGS
jgi:hypothetical protein